MRSVNYRHVLAASHTDFGRAVSAWAPSGELPAWHVGRNNQRDWFEQYVSVPELQIFVWGEDDTP